MSKIKQVRNEVDASKKRLEEIDKHCQALKDNFDVLSAESDNKSKTLVEVKTKLTEVQTELEDTSARVRELNENVEEYDQNERAQEDGNFSEETMVIDILEILKKRQVVPASLVPTNGKTAAAAVSATQTGFNKNLEPPKSVTITFFHRDMDGMAPESATFKLIRNNTFEQLLEDCCRYWDLFPPDVKLINQGGGKWNLESLVDQEWLKTSGENFEIKLVYIEEDEENENLADMAQDEEESDNEAFQVDLRKVWPPPVNRKQMFRELILYVIFCAFYIMFIGTQRDTTSAYTFSRALQGAFAQERFGDTNQNTFMDVRQLSEVQDFFTKVIVANLFEETYYNNTEKPLNERGSVLKYNKIVGGVLMKQHRVQAVPCEVSDRESLFNATDKTITKPLVEDCYPTFKESIASKIPFGKNPKLLGFQFVENPGGQTDNGLLSSYPASGFIRNIPLTPLTKQAEFADAIQELLDNEWIDSQTRAIVCRFIVYNANFDLNMQISFTIEQTPAGEFLPYSADFEVFRIFKLQLQMSLEFIAFFAIFGFLISYSWAELNQARHCKRITGSYNLYISDIWNIIEVFIVFSTCGLVGLFAALFTHPVALGWTYFRNTYPEIGNYIYIQQRLFDLFAVNVFLLVFKLFKFFPLNPQLNMLWKMLKVATANLMNFLIMLMVLFVGFVVMANMIFGTHLSYFTQLGTGFVYLYLYLLGSFDYNALKQTDSTWGPIFFSVYMVLFVMVMLNVFLAILNDAYVIVHDDYEARKVATKPKGTRKWKDFVTLIRRSMAKHKFRSQDQSKQKED